MFDKFSSAKSLMPRWALLAIAGVFAWALVAVGLGSAGASTPGQEGNHPTVTCPLGQCFEDVLPANTFYTYINNLYMDGVIGGYTCVNGTSEPCVPPYNRPYYRPGNNVNRSQMSKFIDLGRRNIADAVGHSLYISTTAGIAVDAETRSGGEAVYAECLQSGNNCYALEGYAPTGDFAGYLYGGRGVYAESDDTSYAGVDANAYGNSAYALSAESSAYRGGYVKSDNTGLYSLYVDTQGGPSQATAGLEVNGSIRGEGNLYMAGSKAGYVVDIMQNAGKETLEAGDVVIIVGNSAPVLGQIPVVTVKKANSAYDTGVTGIVDQVIYVPDASTKAAYDKQEAAIRAAMQQRNQAMVTGRSKDNKPDVSSITMPEATITDEQGTLHADPSATQVGPNGYASVVTLGSYKAVKVDASFGPIHAGDLLVSSPHAGYAMKATDRTLTSGATIGKALGNLDSGTGLIPVIVTLK